MASSIVPLALTIEQAIASVTKVTKSELWLEALRTESQSLRLSADFPSETVRKCAAIETAISSDRGSLIAYYVWLASGCLTSAFIMTQRNAALRRIETSCNESLREALLKTIRTGDAFATVGFSHLTTSRRHLSQPALRATRREDGWILDGFSPWVTGGPFADYLVLGAVEVESGSSFVSESKPKELLFCLAKDTHGIVVEESGELIALNASATGQVRFEGVRVTCDDLLHGPIENVMEASSRMTGSSVVLGAMGGAGGLQTSALAIGHAAHAIEYLLCESKIRQDLRPVAESFQTQWSSVYGELMDMDRGEGGSDPASLRKKANDLALRSTQAAMVAAKGLGFTCNHPVGRWCTEALFFLVWSCPQSVSQAHLCSFMA